MFSFMQSRVDRSMHMHRLLSLFSKKKKEKKNSGNQGLYLSAGRYWSDLKGHIQK